MKPGYMADIGLEIHAELQTQSKMFCACPVVDLTQAPPNTAVCPVCAGLPGALPVINRRAIDYALRVALALECTILETSLFARKNYFYPDLPKGYQISQYEHPLAQNGKLPVRTDEGWLDIRIRRVHLEEDTAKLSHMQADASDSHSLVDLNRAGIPLLEIVSEPDMHTIEQVRAYTRAQRTLLQYLGVNSGDLEKGVIRFEANVSVRPFGSKKLGTRVEIKNLNSFRTMTDAIAFELERQTSELDQGRSITQATLGWDEVNQVTVAQRNKEEAHDYRYFPEPDLPPLTITQTQISAALADLPERPDRRFRRYVSDFGLGAYQADLLTGDKTIADFFEATLSSMPQPDPTLVANWILGDLFALMNASSQRINDIRLSPRALASLINLLQKDRINNATAKSVLSKSFTSGDDPLKIIQDNSLEQVSDQKALTEIIKNLLSAHPQEVKAYRNGKTQLRQWFFGQVMQQTSSQANPAVIQELLDKHL